MSTKALTRSFSNASLMDDFFKPWNEWFDNGGMPSKLSTLPAVNVKEDKDHYFVALAVPGLQKNDFNIDIEGNMLTISSEKEETREAKEERFTRKEYSYSSFSRSFTLPDDVKQDAIDARYENGVLTIKMPRKEESKKLTVAKKVVVK